MARDYQRKKNNRYILPKTVYHCTLWKIRDYYRLKDEADAMINHKGDDTCQVQGGSPSDPVMVAVVKRERYIKEVDIISNSLKCMPVEYRQGVWENIHFGQAFPLCADRSTFGRYKSKYIYTVAKRLDLIREGD